MSPLGPDAPTDGASGRRDRRFLVRMPVNLSLGDGRLELRTGDISLRGMFLRTDRVLRPSQFIRVDMSLPFSGKNLSLFASVMFSMPPPGTPDKPPGTGVELYGNGADELKAWREFILEVERRFPESLEQPIVLEPGTNPSVEPVRRRFQRFEAALQVRGYFGELDDLVLMYTRDVSKGGMFITTSAVVDVGAELSLQLVHPVSQQEFAVSCVVRRVVADRLGRGMGVEFLDMDEHQRHQLWDFISSGVRGIPEEDQYLVLPEAEGPAMIPILPPGEARPLAPEVPIGPAGASGSPRSPGAGTPEPAGPPPPRPLGRGR